MRQGVEIDYTEAAKWYRKAAEQGDAVSQFFFGICYVRGDGVKEDCVEVVKWYRKAAEQDLVVAQYNLGFCYYNGDCVAQDKAEAVKWFRKAAENGKFAAMEILSEAKEKELPISEEEAQKWAEKVEEQRK